MLCTPPKCKSSPCSQDSFALDSVVFHAKLGRKPCIDPVIVAPEMFELVTVNFPNTLLPTRAFPRAIAKRIKFQSRFSLRSEDLMGMMRSGKSSTKSLGSTVSSTGTVAMVG